MKVWAYLEIIRPANGITAIADIWVGAAIAMHFLTSQNMNEPFRSYVIALGTLSVASFLLYSAGITFNDFFDAELDSQERPERPIPRGAISKKRAAFFGGGLFVVGIGLSIWNSFTSGILSFIIMGLCLSYNAKTKHHSLWGPVNMGLCRAFNWALGISLVPEALGSHNSLVVLFPLIHIIAVTRISQGEVHGSSRLALYRAGSLYGLVLLGLAALPWYLEGPWLSYGFAMLWGGYVLFPLTKAIRTLNPPHIGLAVRAGVLSLIMLDAAVAASFYSWEYALVTLSLFPVSRALAHWFSVT